MPVVISEMRTGSTYVSEVLSYTLYNRGYHYIRESDWMDDAKAAFAKGDSGLVKIHHVHYDEAVLHANDPVRIVVTVRDPLDVYLSATHHLAFTKGWSFAESLAHLESFDWVERMTKRMMSFIDTPRQNMEVVRYEKLIVTPVVVLSQTLRQSEDRI